MDSETISTSDSLPTTRPLLLYFYFMAIAVLYYDHFLTFPLEFAYIWRRPKSRSTYWFFLNRYLTFFTTVPITIFNFVDFDHDVCSKYALFRQILLVVQVVVVDLILSLRVYAMYGLDKRILYILCCGTVMGMGITGWSISAQQNSRALEDYSVPGCFIPLSHDSGSHLVAVWEALLAYDLLIFGIILFRSSRIRLRDTVASSSTPIMYLMLRDGALYFVAMALANLSNIISFYIGGPFVKGGLSTFATSVSVTMTSRLMVNLHAFADRGLYTEAISRDSRSPQILDSIVYQPYSTGGTGFELETRRRSLAPGYSSP
ncbi:hypothetical protein B0H10DRAFT_2013005 [Mycena sp. CBHHK59/15]|nr:hypothetical protein B0H10DRAFT_2013005 [Mycena sp. CBHHK59/15]